MDEVITYLMSGTVLGITSGISPGPLLTLVVTETLRHGKREGVKVAMAPLLTDLPIVAIALGLLSGLSGLDFILGLVALSGGIFIFHLGFESIRTGPLEIDSSGVMPKSIKRGFIVNILSPHPYLFWITVGGPFAFRAWQSSAAYSVVFIAVFYVCLVGSKITVALLVDRSRNFLGTNGYIWTMRFLGVLLMGMAILFAREAVGYFCR